MARTVNVDLLDQKIEKAELEVAKARKNYEEATAELKKLVDKREALRSQEIMKLITDSPLSYNEVVNLIKNASAQVEE